MATGDLWGPPLLAVDTDPELNADRWAWFHIIWMARAAYDGNPFTRRVEEVDESFSRVLPDLNIDEFGNPTKASIPYIAERFRAAPARVRIEAIRLLLRAGRPSKSLLSEDGIREALDSGRSRDDVAGELVVLATHVAQEIRNGRNINISKKDGPTRVQRWIVFLAGQILDRHDDLYRAASPRFPSKMTQEERRKHVGAVERRISRARKAAGKKAPGRRGRRTH